MTDSAEKALELIEAVRTSGKLKRGTNEVTKAIERGTAKFVVVAKDVNPPEITMHIPLLAKEKDVPFAEVPSREELGAAAGINTPAAAIAVLDIGNAKDLLQEFTAESKKEKAEG